MEDFYFELRQVFGVEAENLEEAEERLPEVVRDTIESVDDDTLREWVTTHHRAPTPGRD